VVRLHWGKREEADFESLLRAIPDAALDSPRRSVVPLVDFCRSPDRAVAALARATGLGLTDAADFVFEHAVPVQKGRGKPSFTDLVILTPRTVLAIEAKYTEPEYETVRSWLRDPVEPNRAAVLEGWLGLLGRVAARPITTPEVLDLPYQLIHRAASACSPDREHRAMAYLTFGETAPHYSKHVSTLAAILGPASLSMLVLSCPITKLPSFVTLERRWDRGERKLADAVRAALIGGPPFSFGELRVEG